MMRTESDAARTDEQLLEQFVAGDQAAFTEFHGRHSPQIIHYLTTRYFRGDEMLAEDCAQQAFFKLVETAADLDLTQPVRPWLYSVASRCAIDVKRWRGRHPAVSLTRLLKHTDHIESPFDPEDTRSSRDDELALNADERDRLREYLDRLPDEDREAVEAVYFKGMKFREAAQALGIPSGSLFTRVHRSLRFLRCRLDSHARAA